MASTSINGDRGSQKGQREYSLVPRMPGKRGMKLLANAQREVKSPFRAKVSLVPLWQRERLQECGHKKHQDKMEEIRQILVANNLKNTYSRDKCKRCVIQGKGGRPHLRVARRASTLSHTTTRWKVMVTIRL